MEGTASMDSQKAVDRVLEWNLDMMGMTLQAARVWDSSGKTSDSQPGLVVASQ